MTSKMILRVTLLLIALAVLPGAAQAQEHPDGRVLPQEQQQEVAALPARPGAEHPFAAMAGGWTGGGIIQLTNDITERLRCRADHKYNQGASSLALSIRCASDNYKFELTSDVVERRGQISGQWKETGYGVSGSISGRVAGNRITATATGDKFTSAISVATTGNRQTVSLTPERTYVISVQIELNRAGGAPRATAAPRR
jgi:hypothetical protein